MEQEKENRILAQEYVKEGRQFLDEKRYNEAAPLYESAISIYKQLEDWEECTRNQNMMGLIYNRMGNESIAVDYFLEGLSCAKAHKVERNMSLFYNNLGYRYQVLGQYEKALEFYRQAEVELGKDIVKENERYSLWCMGTYMNMMDSFLYIGNVEQAAAYWKKAKKYTDCEGKPEYLTDFAILEGRLDWALGKEKEVWERLPRLVESVSDFTTLDDYTDDVQQLLQLISAMKAYDAWEQVIRYFERYVQERGTVYFQMLLTEMWMEYYESIGDVDDYTVKCVEHAKLYFQHRKISEQERATAIDIKMNLQQKEAERRQAENKLYLDMLTEIGNRYCLKRDVRKFLRDAVEEGKTIAVGILDIDHFKEQNDTLGHLHGDACLKTVAKIVRDSLAEDGRVYRFGGDEFVLLIRDGSKENLERIAQKIQEELRIHEESKEKESDLPVTISQGYISTVPGESDNLARLMKRADEAMYHVKERGRDGFEILLDQRQLSRLTM